MACGSREHVTFVEWSSDEYIYIFECEFYEQERTKCLPQKYCYKPNFYKFNDLMATADHNNLTKLCSFKSRLYNQFSPP